MLLQWGKRKRDGLANKIQFLGGKEREDDSRIPLSSTPPPDKISLARRQRERSHDDDKVTLQSCFASFWYFLKQIGRYLLVPQSNSTVFC